MRRIIGTAFTLLFASVIIAQSRTLVPAAPAKAGFSAERLQRIDRLVKSYIDSNWISGAIAIVARDGNIVYHKGIGIDDAVKNNTLQKDAIFRIASQTKAITSVGIMMLYEDGRLLLDEPVSKYISGFRKPQVLDKFNAADTSYTTVPAKREITIRDLLTHTSGIGYAQIGSQQMNAIYYKHGVVGGIGLMGGSRLADNINRLASLPLVHQPGEKYTYGLNTDVLGYVIEVISGMSLDDYFRKKIFEPLGMKDTYFYLPKDKQARLAMLHSEDANKKVINAPEKMYLNGVFIRDYPALADGSFYSGGGGLVSTAYDYAVFMQMLLNGGDYNGKRLLSPNTLHLMTINQIGDINMGRAAKFGLGFQVVTEADEARSNSPLGTFSWGGMFASSYWIDPRNKIVAQFVLQQYPMSHGDIAEKFKVAVYQALEK
ncbi:serine hydrolase domain-containing protein [Sediminibacterium soli]|uniref:serine hydrolase domain-containing protein n=1 Tax=Sediminibacterium soli TaxID=2698829 RepID=UPI0013796058|nr:serine hydrolase domain-containing protein [Sediminibacterium soli]NCI45268.1 beta-lactamase family protein [Sediminibacterium soli]